MLATRQAGLLGGASGAVNRGFAVRGSSLARSSPGSAAEGPAAGGLPQSGTVTVQRDGCEGEAFDLQIARNQGLQRPGFSASDLVLYGDMKARDGLVLQGQHAVKPGGDHLAAIEQCRALDRKCGARTKVHDPRQSRGRRRQFGGERGKQTARLGLDAQRQCAQHGDMRGHAVARGRIVCAAQAFGPGLLRRRQLCCHHQGSGSRLCLVILVQRGTPSTIGLGESAPSAANMPWRAEGRKCGGIKF